MRPPRDRRNPESGYALLFILMMAAVIAIMLYRQLPRVAFEAQREREQLLIDRGEQYKRAVQLYVRKFNRFPADMQALENTQNIRFLRKQYVDPMTGKNEWRLIHVGPGGALIDSQVGVNQQNKSQASAPQNFITEMQQIGGNQANPNQGVNQATRRRPSDDPGAPGDPNNPGASALNGPVMVLPDGRIVPATPTGVPASNPGAAGGATAGGTVPGGPAQIPGQFGQQQPGQALPPGSVPQGGFQSTPNGPGVSGNAANLINQILTTPRPGGLNGNGGFTPSDPSTPGQTGTGGAVFSSLTGNNTGVSAGQSLGGSTVGGGIAGVASKMEQEGIKVYNDQTSYNKWEFIYDMSKDPSRTGGTGMPGQPAANPALQQQGNQPQQPVAQPSPASPSSAPPGGTPGTGN